MNSRVIATHIALDRLCIDWAADDDEDYGPMAPVLAVGPYCTDPGDYMAVVAVVVAETVACAADVGSDEVSNRNWMQLGLPMECDDANRTGLSCWRFVVLASVDWLECAVHAFDFADSSVDECPPGCH